MRRRLMVLGIAVWTSGCVSTAFTVPENVRPISELPDAANGTLSLGPGDLLEIRFFGRPDLSGQFLVNQDGAIRYPLAGRVSVAGLGGEGAEAALREALSGFFETPDILMTPLIRVNVLGAVVQPGLYPLNPTFTVYDAIGSAGGPSRDANFDEILLVRSGSYFMIETGEALRAGRSLSQIGIRSGDVILVPERPRTLETVARLSSVFGAFVAALNTVLILTIR